MQRFLLKMHQLDDMGSVNAKTWSWGLCPWFLFCAQKKGKRKGCKGFRFLLLKNQLISFSLFRKNSHNVHQEYQLLFSSKAEFHVSRYPKKIIFLGYSR